LLPLQFCQPGFLETTGLAEDQIVGKHIEDVIPEPSLSMVRDNYKKLLWKKDCSLGRNYQISNRDKDWSGQHCANF